MWQKSQINKNQKFRSSKSLRYSSKDYNNPYFARRKRKKRRWQLPNFNIGWKVKIGFYIAIVLFVFFLIWLFGTDFFLVNTYIIEGGGRINVNEIENVAKEQTSSKRWLVFPEKHILFYDTEELKIELEKKYAFDSIEIDKKLPGTIVLNYQEKSYAIIWEEDNNYFYSDNTGLILEEANLLEIGERDYPIIKNETGARTLGASILANQEYINAAMDIFSQIKNYEDIQIERFLLDTEINNIKFKIVSGPLVMMNMEEDIVKQINKLIIIKNEKIKDDFWLKEYIDVRYGDSVYYR
jgi:cell division septal protein FtsQ